MSTLHYHPEPFTFIRITVRSRPSAQDRPLLSLWTVQLRLDSANFPRECSNYNFLKNVFGSIDKWILVFVFGFLAFVRAFVNFHIFFRQLQTLQVGENWIDSDEFDFSTIQAGMFVADCIDLLQQLNGVAVVWRKLLEHWTKDFDHLHWSYHSERNYWSGLHRYWWRMQMCWWQAVRWNKVFGWN